ncbi:multidrug resistance protein 2 [Ditylenchus destructor]|nr:multidrug resistance protein 2 [Ditylenchus destructor]
MEICDSKFCTSFTAFVLQNSIFKFAERSTEILTQAIEVGTVQGVSIDGTDVRQYNIKHVRQAVSVVGQEPILFNFSIAQNIAYGMPPETVSEGRIEEVARLANIHDFVMSLPEKIKSISLDFGLSDVNPQLCQVVDELDTVNKNPHSIVEVQCGSMGVKSLKRAKNNRKSYKWLRFVPKISPPAVLEKWQYGSLSAGKP